MNRVVLNGPAADVRWSYYIAASLGPWTLTAEPGKNTVTARVVTHDAHRVSQHPLAFVVARPTGQAWRWPIETLQIVDGTLTATLGPQE